MSKSEEKLVIDLSKYYQPTAMQIQAHRSPSKYILAGGGIRSGKSFWMCAEAIQLSLDFPKNRGYICRHENATFMKSTFLTLEELLPPEAVVRHHKQQQFYELINGSQIYYGGLKPTQALKPLDRIKSMTLGFFGIDEATETTEEYFLFLMSRLTKMVRNIKYKGLLTCNPEDGWVKRRFIDQQKPDHEYFEMLPSQNPHLPEGWEEEMRVQYSDVPGWTRRLLEGDWNVPSDSSHGFGLIQYSWTKAASQRDLPFQAPVQFGVDVAGGGLDKTVIVCRRGDAAEILWSTLGAPTTVLIGKLKELIEEYAPSEVKLDATGAGWPIYQLLLEHYQEDGGEELIIPYIGGAKAFEQDRFFNSRSEGFWLLQERFKDGNISIPNDPELMAQLANLRYSIRSDKKVALEPKDRMRRRGIGSPDKADALMMAFYELSNPPLEVLSI